MNTNTTKNIRNRVRGRKKLSLFTIHSISRIKQGESYHAASKELSRLVSNGNIKRLKTGIYYKPKQTRFGEITPKEEDILRFLLYDQGKKIGYVSGERAYNGLGLTTQISRVVTIATCEHHKRERQLGRTTVRYVKAYGNPKTDNEYLLQILDAIKDIKTIPDANTGESLRILHSIIKKMSDKNRDNLSQIAEKYPKRVSNLLNEIILEAE